jgi:shikimate kinase
MGFMRRNLILFGDKAVGKTYFGRLLAQELRVVFVETDLLIEERGGASCRQIYLNMGERHFRRLERDVVRSLKPPAGAIIAVGGGTVLDPESCAVLSGFGPLVYLEAEKETIRQRMLSGGVPAFLDRQDPERSFEKIYEERKLIYEQICSFKIKIHKKTDRQVLDELIFLGQFG